MPSDETGQPIRILHLSDIHFRGAKSWDADPVLRALARFVGTEVENGLAPDLVVVTGDLAHAGVPDDYALAREWLEIELWPALPEGLPRDRLLLVPGNHDVDRSKVRKGVQMRQDALLSGRSQEDIAELLDDEDERGSLLRRHTAYLEFVGDWLEEPQALPWWQRIIEIRGRRLHVAGLDSAWMACGDEDRGRLLLGRYQLTQTVETVQAEEADWRVALIHHPWDYLAEFDSHKARSTIHQHRDLVLRGHLHEPLSERVLPPDPARGCLELAAGCLYENSDYPNAFQWIELSQEGKRVRVLFRVWLHNAWCIDRNQPNCPDGEVQFDLSAPLPSSSAPDSPPTTPMIPPDYLAWLRRRYASVELLGQDIHQGQAITLNQVYVPALTQPAADCCR